MPAAKDGRKLCPKCGKTKKVEEFGKHTKRKDGLRCWCKDCVNRTNRQNKTLKQKYRLIGRVLADILFQDLQLKLCPVCGEIKGIKQFHQGGDRFGLGYRCNDCDKQYYQDNKERIIKRMHERCQQNRERNLREGVAIIEKRCTRCGQIKDVDRFDKGFDNADGLHDWCKDCRKKWGQEHVKELREYQRQYRQDNKEKRNAWERQRYQTNPIYKLNRIVAWTMRYALKFKGGSKQGKQTKEILASLGYTTEDLKTHLESQFQHGMTWDNWGNGPGKWNIDHIKPIVVFDFTSPDDPEFQECWGLDNLQPLWWEENMKKGPRYRGKDYRNK